MDTGNQVVVVPTGTANIASVVAALERLGAGALVSGDPVVVENATRLVLPGVGTLGAAMDELNRLGIAKILAQRVKDGRPTLAICLGLQMLCDRSDESAGALGLGVVPGTISRFGDEVRVPQLGWNKITPQADCSLLEEGYVYFANSYRLVEPPAGWSTALCDYGGRFVAAVEKGDVLACQFHPELSGELGLGIMDRWLARGDERGGERC